MNGACLPSTCWIFCGSVWRWKKIGQLAHVLGIGLNRSPTNGEEGEYARYYPGVQDKVIKVKIRFTAMYDIGCRQWTLYLAISRG